MHIWLLLGLLNQLLLIAFGAALCVAIVLGYRLWWMRRPAQGSNSPLQTLSQAWLALSWTARTGVLATVVVFGLAMPLMGISLALFMLVDWLRWRQSVTTSLAQSVE